MMRAEVYLDRNTAVHRLDPRTKLALMLAAFVTACYFEHPLWVAAIAAAICAHAVVARALPNLAPLRSVLVVLALSSLVLWNFFARGVTPLFAFVSAETLLFSAGRALMVVSVAVAGVTFLSTTRIEELVIALIRLGVPYRVGFVISTAMRLRRRSSPARRWWRRRSAAAGWTWSVAARCDGCARTWRCWCRCSSPRCAARTRWAWRSSPRRLERTRGGPIPLIRGYAARIIWFWRCWPRPWSR